MQAACTNSVFNFHYAERKAIIDALKAASDKIASAGGAVEQLGLKRPTFQKKVRRLNISGADYTR